MSDLSLLIDEKIHALAARRACGKIRRWIDENLIPTSERWQRLRDDMDALAEIIDLDIEHVDNLLAEETGHIKERVRAVYEIRETLDAMPCEKCGDAEATCNCECGEHYCGCPCHVDDERRAKAALAVQP